MDSPVTYNGKRGLACIGAKLKPQGVSRIHSMSSNLSEQYLATRRFSERLCESLSVEDFVVQSMPDASPTRWHLAHTTWFFETFVLARWKSDYRPVDPHYQYLFNSYYNGIGEQFPRSQRGLLTRPTVDEVFSYRHEVDGQMTRLLATPPGGDAGEAARVVELGIHHEQQHQELLLTDIKHVFSCNPLAPVYRASPPPRAASDNQANCRPSDWSLHAGGVAEVGHEGASFSFDNERPRHRVFLNPFELQHRLVTSGEFLAFIQDGGYRAARSVAVARLVDGARPAMVGAAVLDREGRSVVAVHAQRTAAAGRRGAGLPRQLFRSRCLCPLVGGPLADRGRMGTRRPRSGAGWRFCRVRAISSADRRARSRDSGEPVWRGVAMDVESVHALPRLRGPARGAGRIQRQVHVQSVCLARRFVRHAGQPHSRHIPKLFSARRSLAVQRTSAGPRRKMTPDRDQRATPAA